MASLRALGYNSSPQVEFHTGGHTYFVDRMLAGEQVIFEFDGAVKYRQSTVDLGRQVLMNEKRREDDLRSLGLEVVRVDWAHVGDLRWLRDRVEAARRRARR